MSILKKPVDQQGFMMRPCTITIKKKEIDNPISNSIEIMIIFFPLYEITINLRKHCSTMSQKHSF